jgi:hypothetical protein
MNARRLPFPFLPVPVATWQPAGAPLALTDRIVLAVFAERWQRGEDAIAIGVPLIVQRTGIRETAVKLALGRLVRARLLVRLSTGDGRGRVSSYRLGASVHAGEGVVSRPLSTSAKGARKGVAKRLERGRETSPDIEEITERAPGSASVGVRGRPDRDATSVALGFDVEAPNGIAAHGAVVLPLRSGDRRQTRDVW